jgi:hypothetical protein
MSILTTIRLVTFIAAIVFSVIVLSLSAHIIAFYESELSIYPRFAAMGIAVSLITLLTLPTFMVIDAQRDGAPTSMIIVELATLTLLWVLWLVAASLSAQWFGGFNCDIFLSTTDFQASCHESQAVEAFSFLAFFAILGYVFVLLVFTIIAHNRGHNVWTSSVKQTNFFAPPVNPPPDAGGEKGMPPQQQQQYQYPPQQNFAPPPQNFAPPPQQYGTPPPGAQYMPPPQQQQYPQYTGSPVPQNPPLPGHA